MSAESHDYSCQRKLYFRAGVFPLKKLWHVSWESQFRCYAGYKLLHVPIYPNLIIIIEGRRNCSTFWPASERNRDSQETNYQISKHAIIDGRISRKIWEIYRFTVIYIHFLRCWGPITMLTSIFNLTASAHPFIERPLTVMNITSESVNRYSINLESYSKNCKKMLLF